MTFNNQPTISKGIYTPSEVAHILQVPKYKVQRWIAKYWDGRLAEKSPSSYSWKQDGSKAINFHTLIELYVLLQFDDVGVKMPQILHAHQELSNWYDTIFPFAHKDILDSIFTDGKQIFFRQKDNLITLDGSRQLNLDFIQVFFKKLEFDNNNLAMRFWPLGKEKSILIDPERKFGHPVIANKNIYPETIYKHHLADDPAIYIAHVYGVTEKQVEDAINFCKAA